MVSDAQRIADLEGRAEKLYSEVRALRRTVGNRDRTIEQLQLTVDGLANAGRSLQGQPVPFTKLPKSGRKRRGTVCVLLSDLHLDEIVRPEEIDGINAFNRKIAEGRLSNTFNQAASLPRDFASGIEFDGCVAALGGDILTGDIHDELKETNEATPFESIVHWVPRLASGITTLAEQYGRVHVPCVDGNHDRNGKAYRFKRRPQSALSWVLYHWLADSLSSDKRITFDIATGTELLVPVYDTRFLLRHGDGIKGGSGQVGPVGPVRAANLRIMRRQMAVGKLYDWLAVGHWHTYMQGIGLIMNGSMKGYDEYANQNAFDFEPPQQALWVVTPEHGVTLSMPIFCAPKDETW